jgi:hypothetical protein
MPMVVRLYPLVAPLKDLKGFAEELLHRREETDGFYRRFGVTHESWHVQDLPNGTWIICCTEVDDPATTSAEYSASREAFADWFKQRVIELTSVDPNVTPLGPESSEVFCWNAP